MFIIYCLFLPTAPTFFITVLPPRSLILQFLLLTDLRDEVAYYGDSIKLVNGRLGYALRSRLTKCQLLSSAWPYILSWFSRLGITVMSCEFPVASLDSLQRQASEIVIVLRGTLLLAALSSFLFIYARRVRMDIPVVSPLPSPEALKFLRCGESVCILLSRKTHFILLPASATRLVSRCVRDAYY